MRPSTLIWPLLAACAGKNGGAGSNVVSIRVEPAVLEADVQLDSPVEERFTAFATTQSGEEVELDLVSWELSNLSLGEIDSAGLFTSVDDHGGISTVIARHLDVEGSASMTLVYAEDLLDDGVDEGIPDAFKASTPSLYGGLSLAYPGDGVTVPRNLEGLSFFWTLPDGADVARIRFTTDITDVSAYVAGEQWTATSDLWATIAASNREGEVEVSLMAGTWQGGALSDVVAGPPTHLRVNRFDARGSVLYWATANQSVMRIPFGQTEAEDFWTPEDSKDQCTGCHSISEALDRMVVTYGGLDGKFEIIDIETAEEPTVVVPATDDRRVTFKTISPDGTLMLASNKGDLFLYDLQTGQIVDSWDYDWPVVMPDWSPNGEDIVAVRVNGMFNSEFQFTQGELITMQWDGLTLSEPETLVPTDDSGTYTYFYPAWSPDGDWVAFNRSSDYPYSSPTAELLLISGEGGDPILLEEANGPNVVTNSYPRWGPLPDDDILWLAFSSRQAYPGADEFSGAAQVFVTSIDVTLAAEGTDPSTRSFWLPGQTLGSDNHLPYWWSK